MKSIGRFVQAAGKIGWGSVSLAVVLFAISIYEHLRDKNISGYWLLFAAVAFFSYGAFNAWASEHEAFENEVKKNTTPALKIELTGSFFDVAKVPGKKELRLHVFAYLKVTNLSSTEALIKNGTLVMTVDGRRYRGIGDDISIVGNAIEHISSFRIGGEIRTQDVFGENTLSPLRRLLDSVSAQNPLRRGMTQEGFFVFTFTDLKDWNRSSDNDEHNPYVMRVSDPVITLRDSFDVDHTLQGTFLEIPQGNLTNSGRFPLKFV